jgi:hypothetical protein
VKNTGEDLAYLGNFGARKLELSQSILENLETLCIVDSNLELSWMAKILPSLLSGSSGRTTVQAEMRFFSLACSGKKIVKNVEVTLSCGNIGDTATLQTMIQELTTNQNRVCCG